MRCMECNTPTAALIHLDTGGRLCRSCFRDLVDPNYEPPEEEAYDEYGAPE